MYVSARVCMCVCMQACTCASLMSTHTLTRTDTCMHMLHGMYTSAKFSFLQTQSAYPSRTLLKCTCTSLNLATIIYSSLSMCTVASGATPVNDHNLRTTNNCSTSDTQGKAVIKKMYSQSMSKSVSWDQWTNTFLDRSSNLRPRKAGHNLFSRNPTGLKIHYHLFPCNATLAKGAHAHNPLLYTTHVASHQDHLFPMTP